MTTGAPRDALPSVGVDGPAAEHWYARLGVPTLVNAAGRWTRLGGSVMAPEVLDAMLDASHHYVDMFTLRERVGRRVAELTRNEAACVTPGAAAGVVLSLLACRTGADPACVVQVGEGRACPAEVVVYRAQVGPYRPGIVLAGAIPVEIGNRQETHAADFEAAINDRTSAVLYVAGATRRDGALSLDETIALAHGRGVPVVVDAADQLPPVSNLWRFTCELGADLAVFSGGKDLGGPQASGLVVGARPLVDAINLHASPNERIGRPFKVGKEEMVGLVAALERYVSLDEAGRRARWDYVLSRWEAQLSSLPDILMRREPTGSAGQLVPRLVLWREPAWSDRAVERIVERLLRGDPPVAVGWSGRHALALTPEMVSDDEVGVVAHQLHEMLLQLEFDE